MKVSTDAVLLGAWTKVDNTSRALDIGTGCGILALMLAQKGIPYVDAIDLDAESVAEAERNFSASPWPASLNAHLSSLQNWAGVAGGYDLIICNPPYFHDHLPASDPRRARARHSDELSQDAFAHHAHRLASAAASVAIVFPVSFFHTMFKTMASHGWYLNREQKVSTCHGKPPSLWLSEWSKKPVAVLTMPNLCLRDEKGDWHKDYCMLTADFYPHF